MVDSENDKTTPEFGACHRKILFHVQIFKNLRYPVIEGFCQLKWIKRIGNQDSFSQFRQYHVLLDSTADKL